MNRKVSIIVPVFNAEAYLHKCIESILQQTYSNIELILVNDGSLDKSGKICDKIAKSDKRIKVIHKANGGIGSAYNDAFQLLTGEYVCFVDSDDYIAYNMVEKLSEVLISKNADMVCAGIYYVNDKSEIIKETNNFNLEICEGECILYNYLKRQLHPGLGSIIYKRELFDGFNFLEQNLGIDELTTPQILWKCNKVVYIKEKYYYCWQIENSVSRENVTLKNFSQRIEMFNELFKFFEMNFKAGEKYIVIKYLGFLICTYRNLQCSETESKKMIKHIIYEQFKKKYPVYMKNKEFVSISTSMKYSIEIFKVSPFLNTIMWRMLK